MGLIFNSHHVVTNRHLDITLSDNLNSYLEKSSTVDALAAAPKRIVRTE
jgi:hypothetical protein